MSRRVRERMAVLREEFPRWRVRVVGGRWLVVRDGFPLVVRDPRHGLQETLRLCRRRGIGGA